ncbi:hypothetical protein D3C80_1931790 [compost metagenome]
MGDIQRQVGQRHATGQHHLGGMRVGVQVKFCCGRDVAAIEVGTAHDHHLLDTFGDFWALN